MNKNELNKASFLFKDAKLLNLKLVNNKPNSSQYSFKPRSNSFENSLKRVLVNNYEMQSLLTQTRTKTKIKQFHQSFIEEEEDYNKQISCKMLQFGKLLNKIPHPSTLSSQPQKKKMKKDNNNNKSQLDTLPLLVNKQNTTNPFLLTHPVGSNSIKSNTLIEKLNVKIKNFFEYDVKGIKTQSKIFKRKTTLYKYISDEQTRMYFHYFSSDFDINSQTSPEYKFIKIEEESFKVIRALLNVKQIIIDDYYFYQISIDYLKSQDSNNINDIIEYIDYIHDIYNFYYKENEDLLHNYSIVTKCLVKDNKTYLIYINDLCSISESIISEENKFRSNINAIRKEFSFIFDKKGL